LCTIPNESADVLTKHAVLALSECLYVELQHTPKKINVSVALPGIVATRIFEDSTAAGESDAAHAGHVAKHMKAHGQSPEEAARIILEETAAKQYWIKTQVDNFEHCANDRAMFLSQQPMPRQTPPPGDAIKLKKQD
jgi:short-subunit dehydrogenase